MFQLQFVIGLFIGFQFNIIHKVLNAPIDAENDLEPDYNAAEARSLFGNADPSMNEADAYEENELENIFINPEELGPYFEGDIFIPDDLMSKDEPDKVKLWPNGVIPFEISPNFTKIQKEKIMSAVHELTSKTCLRFPMRTIEKDYVHITDKKAGCFSTVGQQGGHQYINLGSKQCFKKVGVIVHEILHSVGFYHEHARNDRDDYVKIIWENILKENIHNFNKRRNKIDPSVDLTYDYGSVLHYSRYAGSNSINKHTIVPLFNTTDALKMGQRIGLSPMDTKKVNVKYHCKNMMMAAINKTKKENAETNVHFALNSKKFWLEFNFTSNHEKTYFKMMDLLKPNSTKSKA